MGIAESIDTVLDRTVVMGYGSPGYRIRSWLPTWPADPPRCDGKVVLVTGAGSGIGLAAAAGFAALGASVRVLGRDAQRAEQAATLTRRRATELGHSSEDGLDVRPVACDVSSLRELRDFVDRFTAEESRLDVLVNNAGVMPGERQHTVDGVELTFATHVLAPFVLIEGLAPLLRAGAPSRVVNVTSGGQYGQAIPQDLESEDSKYSPKKIYARTKREQLAITELWAQRLAGSDIHVHAMHPGWADTAGVRRWMPVFRALTRPIIRNPEQGADTIVWLGCAPEAIRTTGLFWHDRRPRPTIYRVGAHQDDELIRQRLWDHVADLAQRRGIRH